MKTTEHVAEGELATSGEEIFTTSCIACHATSGAGTAGGVGPNLLHLVIVTVLQDLWI